MGHIVGRGLGKLTSERAATYGDKKFNDWVEKKAGIRIPWEALAGKKAEFEELMAVLNKVAEEKDFFTRALAKKGIRMFGSAFDTIEHGSKPAIKSAYEDLVPMVAGLLGVVPAAGLASGYLDKKLGTSHISPDIEEDLNKFKTDPNSRQALRDRFNLYKNTLDDSKGSGLAQTLTGMSVGIPLSLFYSAPKLHAWMKKKIPNESLKDSYMFSSPLGRDIATENLGDLAIASPVASGAGLAAYNMTSGEDPYKTTV
jgi:hypothetical protein